MRVAQILRVAAGIAGGVLMALVLLLGSINADQDGSELHSRRLADGRGVGGRVGDY